MDIELTNMNAARAHAASMGLGSTPGRQPQRLVVQAGALSAINLLIDSTFQSVQHNIIFLGEEDDFYNPYVEAGYFSSRVRLGDAYQDGAWTDTTLIFLHAEVWDCQFSGPVAQTVSLESTMSNNGEESGATAVVGPSATFVARPALDFDDYKPVLIATIQITVGPDEGAVIDVIPSLTEEGIQCW